MLIPQYQRGENEKELLALERAILSRKRLIYQPGVQKRLRNARTIFNERAYQATVQDLRTLVETYDDQAMRVEDWFRPYCPPALNVGSLHICNQVDNIPINCDPDAFKTGVLLLGPQNSGKSRLLIHLVNEILRVRRSVRVTVIDPKGGLANLKSFHHIDLARVSLNLAPPPSCSEREFISELMPILGDTVGLIYGQDIVNEAADIALEHLGEYRRCIDSDTHLCLRDNHEELVHMAVTGPRRPGYRDAASTALSRMIGKSKLFSCRKGLSVGDIVSQNTVLNARALTDDMQCRFLATFLLYWLYQRSRHEPESRQIKHVIVMDDASRLVGAVNQFEAHTRTSPLGHILAVLRATGTCLVAATQLPAHVDPAVLSLSRNMIVVGNINGEENLRIIKNFMSLTDEQARAIVRFKRREVLAFISDSSWPYPIHGFTPHVDLADYTTASPIKEIIEITAWHPLTSRPAYTPSRAAVSTDEPARTAERAAAGGPNDQTTAPSGFTGDLRGPVAQLIADRIHYPFDKVRDVVARLGMSVRVYESAKAQAIQGGYLIASACGKTVYLIPSPKSYDEFGYPCPYRRSTSTEHSFYGTLASHHLKGDPALSRIQLETPIGDRGATVDVTTINKSGDMTAYEITLSTSNLSSNAAKLQDTSYQRIVWLCRDAATAKAVKAYFNKTTALPSELCHKFEYTHFSKWVSQIERSKEKNCGKSKP